MDHNAVYKLCEDVINTPYEQGTNDCNIIVMRLVDLLSGTEIEKQFKYKTLKGGLKLLKDKGYETTIDVIRNYIDEVKYPIDGDIWADPDNPHTLSIVISDRMLAVNDEHTEFNLVPKRNDGTYYRIRT